MHLQIVEADRQLARGYVVSGPHCWAMWIGLTESRGAGSGAHRTYEIGPRGLVSAQPPAPTSDATRVGCTRLIKWRLRGNMKLPFSRPTSRSMPAIQAILASRPSPCFTG